MSQGRESEVRHRGPARRAGTREESAVLLPATLSRDPWRDHSGPSPDLRDDATREAKLGSVIEGKGEFWSFLPPGSPGLG